ncbi:hypothetical protein [Rhizobium sp.]|uniref:hypothetical protein n=1 Tax=Rhizobium sp. TaxID=391 RepID=UPI0028A80FF4
MRTFENSSVVVPVWAVVLGFVALFSIGSGFWLFQTEDPLWLSILSGLFTGFVLFAFGLVTQIYTLRTVEKYRQMGVRALLDNRHDKSYYRPLLSAARREVKVTGASATRFIEDFLDPAADDPTLILKMRSRRKLAVKILVPNDTYMSPTARSRLGAQQAKIVELRREFGCRFEIRRFNSDARHSFLIVDGDFIGGPVFDGDESKHAPAVHVDASKAFAEKHDAYFDRLWDQSVQHPD